MNTDLELTEAAVPWLRYADEPEEWYNKFWTYYIPLGPGRTLLRAFINFAKATSPEQAILMTVKEPYSAAASWSIMSREWDWRKRATSWDAANMQELATTMMQARQMIQMSTLEAAQTLRKALDNPRTAVAAAKEILDRGGIPAVTVHAVKTIPFTADDLAVAAKEVEIWQEQQKNQIAPKKGLVLNG